MSEKKARYIRFDVSLASGPVALHVSPKIKSALQEVTVDFDLYKGVRLGEVMEAVYNTGVKAGMASIIEKLDAVKAEANYRAPGRPRKKRKKSN